MDLGEKRNSLERSIPEGAIAGMNNLKDGLQERMNLHSILRTDLSSIWCSVCRLLCLVLSGPGQCWHYHYLTRSISTWYQGLISAVKFLYKLCKKNSLSEKNLCTSTSTLLPSLSLEVWTGNIWRKDFHKKQRSEECQSEEMKKVKKIGQK